jgi:AcrR family transcriptional regulator
MQPTPPRARRKEARPAELLAAALDAFRARGFAATRMEDIAARAGVSKGTIYLYYPSKQAIFEALVREALLPNLARVEAAMAASAASAPDKLRQVIATVAQLTRDGRLLAIPKLVLTEAGNFPELARFYRQEVVARALRLIAGILDQGMAEGAFRRLDADATARLFIAPLIMSALWQGAFAPVEDHPMDPAALLALHGEFFVRGLAP